MNKILLVSEAAVSSLFSELSIADQLLLVWSMAGIDVDERLPEVQQMRLTQKQAAQSQVVAAPHGAVAQALIELSGLLVVPLYMQRHHVALPSEACDTLTIATQCGCQAYITVTNMNM